MAIFNNLGQTSYSRRQPVAIEGQAGDGLQARSYVNPILPQILTFTIGGTPTDGFYRITLTHPDGTEHVLEFEADATGGDVNADIETGLVASVPASLSGLATVAAGAGTTVVVTVDHPGIELSYATEAPAPGTLAGTETQATGGLDVDLAIMVVDGAGTVDELPILALPDGTASEDLFRGVTVRERTAIPNRGEYPPGVDQIPPAELVSVAYSGEMYVRNRGSVSAARHGLIYVVVDDSGGQRLGQLRADDDGSNSIPLSVSRGYWIDPVAPGEIGRIFLRM